MTPWGSISVTFSILSSALYELLTRLQSATTQLNVSINQPPDRIRAAANYIYSHSRDPFTLKQAAAIAGYSPHYFSSRFSQIIGTPFPEFLLEARLLHAKRLLVSTGLSVKQIATDTGFAQSSYFVACFRRREEMTPQQFGMIHQP